jgi:hypothetical protein
MIENSFTRKNSNADLKFQKTDRSSIRITLPHENENQGACIFEAKIKSNIG